MHDGDTRNGHLATYWRMNLTMRHIGPLFGVSHAAAHTDTRDSALIVSVRGDVDRVAAPGLGGCHLREISG